jgi:NADPH:quinone reductase-like Zn-dependent oxidoreductase
MSKQPLSVPTSLFIFNGLAAHGFWQHQWYKKHNRAARQQVLDELLKLVDAGKVRRPSGRAHVYAAN